METPHSIIAIDIRSTSTRASLFDIVDGKYRFIAQGDAPTSAYSPINDIRYGVLQAVRELENITYRSFFDSNEEWIFPNKKGMMDVDGFAATISAGRMFKIALVGLSEEVSIASAQKLIRTIPCEITNILSLNDREKIDTQIRNLLQGEPDLILIAGGTDQGASHAVMKMVEIVRLANYLTPSERRPGVLYAGNQEIQNKVSTALKGVAKVEFLPNIHPRPNFELLEPARKEIIKQWIEHCIQNLEGAKELDSFIGNTLIPSCSGFGRVIRYLSHVVTYEKGILGVDIDAQAVTIAEAYEGELSLVVYPEFALSPTNKRILDDSLLSGIQTWMTIELSKSKISEYLANKCIYPGYIPIEKEEQAIEQAMVQHVLFKASRHASHHFSKGSRLNSRCFSPAFERILASGNIFKQGADHILSGLLLLNGLQPSGVCTLVLDQNQISSVLGSVGNLNPMMMIQILESDAFISLGTVISPVGEIKDGEPILKIKIFSEEGRKDEYEICKGDLTVIPLEYGRFVQMYLQPLHGFDVGMGSPGRGGKLTTSGGMLGLIVDARGRPLSLPIDGMKRVEQLETWRSRLINKEI